jgi:hypothetical protein
MAKRTAQIAPSRKHGAGNPSREIEKRHFLKALDIHLSHPPFFVMA